MIRLGICDDDAMVRRLLAETVEAASDIHVVAMCASGEEALRAESTVDVWLMDQRMSGLTGSEVCQVLTSRTPAPQVLILTASATEPISAAYRAGACGYLFKDESPKHLVAAIRAAAAGFTVSSTQALAELLQDRPEPVHVVPHRLTLDELDSEVVRLLLAGTNYSDIARQVHLSESGVKKRVAALMKQLGVRSRPQLMARLHEFGS